MTDLIEINTPCPHCRFRVKVRPGLDRLERGRSPGLLSINLACPGCHRDFDYPLATANGSSLAVVAEPSAEESPGEPPGSSILFGIGEPGFHRPATEPVPRVPPAESSPGSTAVGRPQRPSPLQTTRPPLRGRFAGFRARTGDTAYGRINDAFNRLPIWVQVSMIIAAIILAGLAILLSPIADKPAASTPADQGRSRPDR